MTDLEMQALKYAASEDVVVCQSRRTPDGHVVKADPLFIAAGSLTAQKARLVLAMEAGLDVDAHGLGREAHAPQPVQQDKELVLLSLGVYLARFPAGRSRPGTAGTEVES